MKYVKKYFPSVKDQAIASEVEQVADKLERSLHALSIKDLALSEYGERYLKYDMRKIRFILQSYASFILSIANKIEGNYKELSIIDHGGGVGLFSLFAKSLGIKTVIYNDYNPVVCGDAKKIADALKITIDHYSAGDTPALAQYIKTNNLSPRVLVSRNVLEHIYDINVFLKTISDSTSGKLSLFMSTTANVKNPLVNIYTRKGQRRYELEGAPVAWGSNKLDPQLSGINQRKKIIADHFPDLKKEEIEKLAQLTRGKIKQDIITTVENFKKTGKYPIGLTDATNTCDPETGSWVEHLLPIRDYKQMADQNGFSFEYSCGFYNTNYPQKMLNLITPILNFFIHLFGKGGLFLAPFVTMRFEKKIS